LRTHDLTVRFEGLTAVDRATIEVREGEIAGLIGPNGAGKTTLFNAISGFVQPSFGRVYLRGDDVTTWPVENRVARGLGRTFQRLELFRHMTVLENCVVAHEARSAAFTVFDDVVALPRATNAQRDARDVAMQALDDVGLAWARDRRADDLPLGLGRSLELARALCTAPHVLLLDEPSSGLDPAETNALGALIERVARERSLAVLLVEHDVALVSRLCDRVYVMDAGATIAEGTPEHILRDPVVRHAYLGESA
jgi:branched-chain amino acid transport system ATP-binding protein